MKKIYTYNKFVNERFDNLSLRYHAFDIDDNLLHMPTKIHMDRKEGKVWIPEDVSTEKFATIRIDKSNWRMRNNDPNQSFSEFRDWGNMGENTFFEDFKTAVLTKKFAPSWKKFIECIVNGYIFSIVTSRGHSVENIRKAFDWLINDYGINKFSNLSLKNVDKNIPLEDQMINNLLSYHELFGTDPGHVIDEYLSTCRIYAVSSEEFIKKYGDLPVDEAKMVALREFSKKCDTFGKKLGVNIKIGFSDDDPRFVKSAIDEFSELIKDYNIKFTVYDTGGKRMKKIDI